MKASEIQLLKFLSAPKQLIIPIYQRTYSWQKQQCKKFFDDIMSVGSDPDASGHFLGSIVYIENGLYHVADLTKLLVIDGQQRLTTLFLFLSALGKSIEKNNINIGTTRNKIDNLYLFNYAEDGEDRFKLVLTQTDKKTLNSLLEDKEINENYSLRIVENYRYFEEQISKNESKLKEIWSGIQKLMMVDVSLNKEQDNPQLIFESLNSTGLDLSKADLIRNYILMDLEPKQQEEIYQDYWYKMETNFGQEGYTKKFDQFMRYYLTIKSLSGTLTTIREIYNDFKKYVNNHYNLSIMEIVNDIYTYSKYFVRVAFNKESDSDLLKVIKDIQQLKVDVAYPFILEVYKDYEDNKLNKEDFIAILRLIESYVFRRAICGIPTNSMNKTFAALTRNIDKDNYLKSTQLAFMKMKSYKRFPNDQEFCRELMVKDVYNSRNCKYLLLKLENFNRRKELIEIDNYTVEHIMPQNQNLSVEWQKELGSNWQEIQSRYLHTIGNLTLTECNCELSDRPFIEKRTIKCGFDHSPLYLNKMLIKLPQWNEDEINKRATQLTNLACQIWSFPFTAS
ncbi:MAG: DUF262 domain-containing protein [Crocosphaera sp.]|nr:DUF262 domain-containing protein [Crocosphaera sp.]